MTRTISKEPARPLTSREISKIINAILSGFVDWCGAETVCEVLDHWAEHKEMYQEAFREIEKAFFQTGKQPWKQ